MSAFSLEVAFSAIAIKTISIHVIIFNFDNMFTNKAPISNQIETFAGITMSLGSAEEQILRNTSCVFNHEFTIAAFNNM